MRTFKLILAVPAAFVLVAVLDHFVRPEPISRASNRPMEITYHCNNISEEDCIHDSREVLFKCAERAGVNLNITIDSAPKYQMDGGVNPQ